MQRGSSRVFFSRQVMSLLLHCFPWWVGGILECVMSAYIDQTFKHKQKFRINITYSLLVSIRYVADTIMMKMVQWWRWRGWEWWQELWCQKHKVESTECSHWGWWLGRSVLQKWCEPRYSQYWLHSATAAPAAAHNTIHNNFHKIDWANRWSYLIFVIFLHTMYICDICDWVNRCGLWTSDSNHLGSASDH